MSNGSDMTTIYQRPVELLQNLIRFNTTNPPGNEGECISYINHLLNAAGIKTTILARDPARPNLIARLAGQGNAPPLLLYGHVDVVATENETWLHPPFEGKVTDGWVWGRGALDDKGGVTMLVSAFLRAKTEGYVPPGDLILTVVSDEEAGGNYGARYLVENHAAQFKGVRYAIGEFGGFSFYVGRKKFYPIMVAEKRPCRVEVTLRGPSGHPTVAFHGGAMAKLGQVLQQIEKKRMPVHITATTRQMIQTMSNALPFPSNIVIRQLLKPKTTDRLLNMLGKQVEQFEPLLHNNVNALHISMADYSSRIPDRIALILNCNLLPGYSPDNALSELHSIVGKDIELKVTDTSWCEPVPAEPDMGLFDILAGILREIEPEGVPLPLLFTGPTDGRLFSRLGIQTYGFQPMNLPPDLRFWELTHGADERIPVEALTFGTNAIFKVIQRFGMKGGGSTIT
jgi:acetylornithine deacetylase/succinyl-diaminopimelate desuccinylase-like protein